MIITNETLTTFQAHLEAEERSQSTVKKYIRDVTEFKNHINTRAITKSLIIEYKSHLCSHYAPASVNAALASLNCFFKFIHCYDMRVKTVKIQKQIFAVTERELTKSEYKRLLTAAKDTGNQRLCLLMQTVCSTGIRISELAYITVDAVNHCVSEINCKGKRRKVYLPTQLCNELKRYIKSKKIKSGAIFTTRNGKPLDRSNVWSEMKKLCKKARVSEEKVFPHNLRHLFARTYYASQKDISRLADILGHSSINTTRIYTMESGATHQKQINQLDLLYHTRT